MAGLCAVGAELLAAYGDNTGDPGAVLFALVFFAGLYGAPALLVREFSRRAGWGWPSLIMLTLALAIAQAGIIDQSLFAEQYGDYAGWAETRQETYLPALGISAYLAYNFLVGHVVFSFCAPIAIAEAWQPHRATQPWLRPFGIAVAISAYAATALLIMLDPQSQSASAAQLATSAVLAVACVVLGWLMGRRTKIRVGKPATDGWLHPVFVFAITFVLATAGSLGSGDWLGVAVGGSTLALIGALVVWASRQPGWGVRHAAAVGLGFLVSRGAFAFIYYPLAGQVEAIPKYAHNVTMMAIVLIAGWFAFRTPGTERRPRLDR